MTGFEPRTSGVGRYQLSPWLKTFSCLSLAAAAAASEEEEQEKGKKVNFSVIWH